MKEKKGILQPNPKDPPRRANKKGIGNWWNDRPGVMGSIDLASDQIRLEVLMQTSREEVQAYLNAHRKFGGICYSDEHLAC